MEGLEDKYKMELDKNGSETHLSFLYVYYLYVSLFIFSVKRVEHFEK